MIRCLARSGLLLLVLAIGSAHSSDVASAAPIVWDGTSGASWNDPVSWSQVSGAPTPNPSAPPGATDTAIFNITSIHTSQIVTLATAQAQGLVFNSNGTVLIQTGTLALGASGITINALAGADTVSSSVSLVAAQSWTNNSSNLFTVSGNLSNGSNLLTIAGAGSTTIGGILGPGTGGLTKSGAGTLTLSNSNTFNGGVTINAGTLRMTSAGAINSTTPNAVAFGAGSTGALSLNGNGVTISGLSTNATVGTPVVQNDSGNAATLTVNNSSSNTYAGVLRNGAGGGSLELVKTGAGTLILDGTNTYTGGTTVSGGTLGIGNDNALSNGALTLSGGAIQADGASHTVINAVNLTAPSTVTGSLNLTLNGSISGSGGLTKTGAGTLNLNGNNSYSGTTTVSAGTLKLGNANALGSTAGFSSTQVASGATLDLGGQAIMAETTLVMDSNASLINSSGSDASWSGSINHAGVVGVSFRVGGSGNITLSGFIQPYSVISLTKEDANVLNLTGTDTNTLLAVTVNSGTLGLSKTSSPTVHAVEYDVTIAGGTAQLGGTGGDQISDYSSVTVTSGAFDTNGRSETVDKLFLHGTGINGNGALVNSANAGSTLNAAGHAGNDKTTLTGDASIGVTQSGGSITLSDPISGNFALTKVGAGTLILSNVFDSDFTGRLNLNAGTLAVGSDTAAGTGALTFNGGAIRAETAARTLANAVNLAATGIVTGSLDLTLSGPISGTGGLIKDGTGTLTLSGANTFTGGVTIAAGTLAQSGGTLPGVVTNQASFVYYSGTFPGQLVNQGTATFNADFTAGNGLVNYTSITAGAGFTFSLNGSGLDNQGTAILAGGTIAGAGPLRNNALVSGTGTLSGAGGFTNNAQLSASGGNVTLSNGGANVNTGNIDIPAGLQLRLTGGNLANSGTVNVNGGIVTGTAALNNNAGGKISGHGTVSSPFGSNVGSLEVESGTLNIPQGFANSGEIFLGGGLATLGGAGTITNTGLIRGDGKVAKAVNNNAGGEIRAELGKRIKLEGVSGASAGRINLQGGTAEFAQALTNGTNGQITGRGTLMVGGAGLANQGQVALASGIIDVFGDVNNSTGSSTKGITISGNADVSFWDDVTNGAGSMLRVASGSSATFFGTYGGAGITGTGSVYFESDITPGFSPASIGFGGTVNFGSTAILKIELGGTTPGGEYDQLLISGGAALSGTLAVDLIDGFLPAPGDDFVLMTYATHGGTFGTHILPPLSSGLEWTLDYGAMNLTLSVTSTLFPGDIDQDGDVDRMDAALFSQHFGTTGGSVWATGDFDSDGATTLHDLSLLQSHLGMTVPSPTEAAAAVPEPSSCALVALVVLTAMVRRRGRMGHGLMVG